MVDMSLWKVGRKGKLKAVKPNHLTIMPEVLEAIVTFSADDKQDSIQVWCETVVKGTSKYYRCFPDYQGSGPFYDWVKIEWNEGETAEAIEEKNSSAVCKLLAFFKTSTGELKAVAHCSEWSTGKETTIGNTRLVTCARMEYRSNKSCKLRCVPASSIIEAVFAFENRDYVGPIPEGREVHNLSTHFVRFLKPVDEWPGMFVSWAKSEKELP